MFVRRTLAVLAAVVCATGLVAPGAHGATSERSGPTVKVAAPVGVSSGAVADRAALLSIKAALDASLGSTRTSQTSPHGVIHTYRYAGGSTFVLTVPNAAGTAVTPMIGFGGCGLGRLCIYLSRTEQGAILAGSGAAIAAGICAVTGPIGCAVAAAVVAAIFYILNEDGRCPTSTPRLRYQIAPWLAFRGCVQ